MCVCMCDLVNLKDVLETLQRENLVGESCLLFYLAAVQRFVLCMS